MEKADWKDFTDYEEAVNSVIGKHRMMALCTYSLEKCGVVEILDVVKVLVPFVQWFDVHGANSGVTATARSIRRAIRPMRHANAAQKKTPPRGGAR